MIDINDLNHIKDTFSRILDLSLISILVYYIYKNVINSYSTNLLKGMLIITSIGIISYYLNLYTISWLLNYIANILPITLVILFNQEIKKIIMKIGNFNLAFKLSNKKEETLKVNFLKSSKQLNTCLKTNLAA